MKPGGRRSGIINPYVEAGEIPRALPAVSDFSTGTWPEAYWRRTNFGQPWVFRGSGAQIIRDVRTELGISADGSRLWTPAVGEAIWGRLGALGVQPAARPSAVITSGAPVPAEWLRWALWLTYDGHNPLSETQLPRAVRLPIAGVALPAADGHFVTQVQLNTADLPTDPFRTVQLEPIDVDGAPPVKKKSSAAKWLLGLAALGILASGSKGGD